MTKREANKLRDRVQEKLGYNGQQLARDAWHRAWPGEPVKLANIRTARVLMLQAIDEGKPMHEAERIARAELMKGVVA